MILRFPNWLRVWECDTPLRFRSHQGYLLNLWQFSRLSLNSEKIDEELTNLEKKPHEFLLMSEIISGARSPSSIFLPTCRQPNSPNEISVCISANCFWMSWKDAKGDWNCFLGINIKCLKHLQTFILPLQSVVESCMEAKFSCSQGTPSYSISNESCVIRHNVRRLPGFIQTGERPFKTLNVRQ